MPAGVVSRHWPFDQPQKPVIWFNGSSRTELNCYSGNITFVFCCCNLKKKRWGGFFFSNPLNCLRCKWERGGLKGIVFYFLFEVFFLLMLVIITLCPGGGKAIMVCESDLSQKQQIKNTERRRKRIATTNIKKQQKVLRKGWPLFFF